MTAARIRMFRQGLGDCFLLSFAGPERDAHVLIDFGVLLGTQRAQDTMRRCARQIVEATHGRLDVLAVTHEHWDHVSGFAQVPDELAPAKLQVDEVWMAWTEKPGDPLAAELDKHRARALKSVRGAAQRLSGMAGDAGRTAERLNALLEFFGGFDAAGRRTTRTALEWVRNRAAPQEPKYLEPGMPPFDIPGSDDVRVYVLGPPRTKALLKKSDPSKRSSEVYELGSVAGADGGFFAAIDAATEGVAASAQPFEEWFRVGEAEARRRTFFQDHYGFEGEDPRRIEHDWLGLAGRIALQLDSDTNNTSLVLALESKSSGRVMLFPGDAQVGNWLSWHEGLTWHVDDGGRTREVTAADLLKRTVLYKVGHHGSHNATLREKGLELMTSAELMAMLPVDRATAKKMAWAMPFPSLYERLEERCKGRIVDLEKGLDAACFVATTKIEQDWIELSFDF